MTWTTETTNADEPKTKVVLARLATITRAQAEHNGAKETTAQQADRRSCSPYNSVGNPFRKAAAGDE
eukprot:3491087-Amphidinium_carterae.1